MSDTKKKKTVVVGMSGGVDSSVAAALLLEQGFDVIGITMKTYDYDNVGGNIGNESSCCGLDAMNDARMVAVKLGISHYVVDFTNEFEQEVISNFIDEYMHGRTPNPCIICNKKIKWGELIKKADSLGADYIATGHYAKILFDKESKLFSIFRPIDRQKDQTYALWGLDQEALRRTIFPLGNLDKSSVREIAKKHGFKNALKEDSFEICFVPDNNYRRFLKDRRLNIKSKISEGNIIFDGKVVGKHNGFPFYTIGQRSGIGAHKEKVYVTDINSEANTITIGRENSIHRKELIARDINFSGITDLHGEIPVQAQVRYKDTPSPAMLFFDANNKIRVVFYNPKRAITPGQSVVLYQDEKLIGGGIIEQAIY
jgi:tRNA-specific 2-thiouridylase